MRVDQHLLAAIRAFECGRADEALMNACIAVDATARDSYPSIHKVGKRYRRLIRDFYWLLEPMLGGINLVETRFENAPLPKNASPDLADIVYEVFRCSHAHGSEVPAAFSLLPVQPGGNATWKFGPDEWHMPDCVVWALIAVVVLARVHSGWPTLAGAHFSLNGERFLIHEWWGREADFRAIAAKHNTVRVRLEKMHRLLEAAAAGAEGVARIQIALPSTDG